MSLKEAANAITGGVSEGLSLYVGCTDCSQRGKLKKETQITFPGCSPVGKLNAIRIRAELRSGCGGERRKRWQRSRRNKEQTIFAPSARRPSFPSPPYCLPTHSLPTPLWQAALQYEDVTASAPIHACKTQGNAASLA